MDTQQHYSDHGLYDSKVKQAADDMNQDSGYNAGLDADDVDAHCEWDKLPQEIMTTIFSHLTMSETAVAEQTCVSWMRSCNDPYLWRRMEFYFDGLDSLRLVAKAFRIIASKGHLVRELVVRIGNPRLNQAWLMSECIKQLFDFITQHSETCRIESFTIDNLVIFTQNRFFRLSSESILESLNNFLRSQKNLKCVIFASCKFNPVEGLKLIRTLRCSAFQHNLKTLHLHNFFKRRFLTASRGFKMISHFPALEEFSVDANNIENYLSWLTVKKPQKKPLRRLKLHFDALKPIQSRVSEECWAAACQSCSQGLKVSFHFHGWLAEEWLKPFLSPAVPLVKCHICWNRIHRGPPTFYTDLSFLLDQLANHNYGLLESFTLVSDVRALPEQEEALIRLASACLILSEFTVLMRLSETTIATLKAILSQRRHPVKCRFTAVQRSQTNNAKRLRQRGC